MSARNEAAEKPISDVIETCWAAAAESGVTFVHLNGGFQGSRGLEFATPYVRAIKRDVGMLVGVQLAPEPVFARYDALIDAGVDHLSFCLELLDPDWFARICPGKDRVHGQELFIDAMSYCAARMPRGAVSGEIIAGIEPIERTLEAIDLITSLGAFPTVCIFRPTVGSDMEDWPPPSLRRHAASHGAHVRRVPPPLAAHRRRAEHRSEPGRQSRRRGDAAPSPMPGSTPTRPSGVSSGSPPGRCSGTGCARTSSRVRHRHTSRLNAHHTMSSTLPPAEAFALQSLVNPTDKGIASRVLARTGGGNITIFAFDAGEELSEHTAPFDALVIVLEGAFVLTIGGQEVRAAPATIVRMPANVPHAVRATEPSRLLLIMLREPKPA